MTGNTNHKTDTTDPTDKKDFLECIYGRDWKTDRVVGHMGPILVVQKHKTLAPYLACMTGTLHLEPTQTNRVILAGQ